jgi:hypothetical protein
MGRTTGAIVVAASLAIGALLAGTSAGAVGYGGDLLPWAWAAIAPVKLPRTQPAPVTLSVGFKSSPVEGSIPELGSIGLELSRHITIDTAGLPSCPLAKLYATSVSAQESCAKSLVGHGSVTSEILDLTRSGPPRVTVTGRLLAFYAMEGKRRLILAQVETGEPLPLVYVIPFTIGKATGSFGTDLSVSTEQMARIQGECPTGNPYCSYSPHKLVGVYGHISSFEMSLHRVFRGEGGKASFLGAVCPAPPGFSQGSFSWLNVRLSFVSGAVQSNRIVRNCKAAD